MMKYIFSAILLSTVGVSLGQQKCGQTPVEPISQDRVIGGINAKPFSWPWQIAYYGFGFNCGGSLIDNQWVMTAGHCAGTPAGFLKIKLGVYDRSKGEEGALSVGVEKVIRHPKYKSVSNYYAAYDIALVKLKEPVTFTDHIQPVCLPNADSAVVNNSQQASVVTGWGKTGENAGISNTLKQATLHFVDGATCKKQYTDYYDAVDTAVMVCAGEDGRSSCNGDSGGPLVVKTDKGYYQYGIVSFGAYRCQDDQHPTVFSRVAAFCDFINETTGKTLCVA